MTSRQPGTAPPGATGTPDSGPMPGTGPRAVSGPWPLVLPLILLIILGMAGLRGAVTQLHWNGPLRRDGLAVGLALAAVLGILLVITISREFAKRNARDVTEVAVKLRALLIYTLGAGMIAVAATTLVGLHLHLFTQAAKQPSALKGAPTGKALVRTAQHLFPLHVPAATLLYGLLIVALLAAVALSIWWSRRFRLPGGPASDGGLIAEDPHDLREALESGRSALRALDDARAAIIACYAAMEASLAERGTTRAVADTPDELLARATQSGLVRGGAAARLTALFYEARFSSHPLGRSQRDAAERALDELAAALAAALAEPRGAGT